MHILLLYENSFNKLATFIICLQPSTLIFIGMGTNIPSLSFSASTKFKESSAIWNKWFVVVVISEPSSSLTSTSFLGGLSLITVFNLELYCFKSFSSTPQHPKFSSFTTSLPFSILNPKFFLLSSKNSFISFIIPLFNCKYPLAKQNVGPLLLTSSVKVALTLEL